MPASNAFTGFTTGASSAYYSSQFNVDGSWSKGWNFKTGIGDNTVFFPAAGDRNCNLDGVHNDVGTGGYYWSAVPASTSNGRLLSFNSDRISPVDSGYRSAGFSVRPVQE